MIILRQQEYSLFGFKERRKEAERQRRLEAESIIKPALPKEYQKLALLEKDIERLNDIQWKKPGKEEFAGIEFNVYKFDDKEDYDIVEEYFAISEEYKDSLIPICHYVGGYFDDIDHTDIFYNKKDRKFYTAYFGSFSMMSPKVCNIKTELMEILNKVKMDVECVWENENPRDSFVNPDTWKKEYYEPCKRLIGRL